ncbi:MAG: DUF1232 domain-containing protein [Candidatus Tectomicrobia bacterium]|nr:DUF1232 domain-containing protein [Candidatus Tectomicrobia bacterium]
MARLGISLFRRGAWLFSMLRRKRYIVNILRLLWLLFRDPRVPLHLKGLLVLAIAYVLSPLDFIPASLFLVFGMVDDFAIVLMTVNYFLQRVPQDVVDEHMAMMDPEFKEAFRQGQAL